jgi:hypothetical protein
MPATYEPIATASPSGTSTVTFSSVPNTYTDLVIVISGSTGGNDTIGLRFNSDSGTNYSYTQIYGDGTSAGSTKASGETFARIGPFYNSQSITIANVMNYANASIYKTILTRANNAGNQLNELVSLWRNTAAITDVTVNAIFGQFNSGTIVSLYGIKAA